MSAFVPPPMLPCPFCGAANVEVRGPFVYSVWCPKCEFHGPPVNDLRGHEGAITEAIRRWNQRAPVKP